MPLREFDLGPVLEHALCELDGNFQLHSERQATVLVPTAYLPPAYLDALGIPEAEPVHLLYTFSGSCVRCGPSDPLPGLEVTYCGHGRSRQLHQQSRPAQITPHDKFLLQVKSIMERHLSCNYPPASKRAAHKLLTEAHAYLLQRLPALSQACVVCDEPLDMPGAKPVPCSNPMCAFAYDELGRGSGLAELYQRPEVADLLLCMACAAVNCPTEARRPLLFATLPAAFINRPATPSQPAKIDWSHLHMAMHALPSVIDMAASQDLQGLLGADKLRLVRWVLATNRSYIAPLAPSERFPELSSCLQFRLTVSSTAAVRQFEEAKRQQGSFYAFHGSPVYNWHSILRSSLRNCSNTPLMSTGQAYGAGVYLGSSTTMSLGYCGGRPARHGSSRGSGVAPVTMFPSDLGSSNDFGCMALCEVINGSDTNAHGSRSHSIHVVPDNAMVITRYLFVFGSGSCPDVLASVLAPKCEQLARQDWTANPPVPEPHSAQSNPTPSLPQAGQALGAARTLSAPSNTVQGSTAAATAGAAHTAAGPASLAGAAPGQHSNLMATAQTLPSRPGWSGSTANLPVRAPQPPVPTPAPAAARSAPAAAAATARLAASAPAPTPGPPQLTDLSGEAGAPRPGTPVLPPAPGAGVVTRSRSSLRPAGPAVAAGTAALTPGPQSAGLETTPSGWLLVPSAEEARAIEAQGDAVPSVSAARDATALAAAAAAADDGAVEHGVEAEDADEGEPDYGDGWDDCSMEDDDDDYDDDMGLAEVDPIPTSAAGQEEARQEQAFMQRHNYMAAPVVTKHLIKELRTLNKMDTRAEGFTAGPLSEDDMTIWEAKLWLAEGTLALDLMQYHEHHGQDFLKLRLHFPTDYPVNPPFVWLVSPRLELQTGYVSRGAICTNMLVNTGASAGWSASYTVDKVLMILLANFQDREARGRINNIPQYREYSEAEARDGFSRAKTLHGW